MNSIVKYFSYAGVRYELKVSIATDADIVPVEIETEVHESDAQLDFDITTHALMEPMEVGGVRLENIIVAQSPVMSTYLEYLPEDRAAIDFFTYEPNDDHLAVFFDVAPIVPGQVTSIEGRERSEFRDAVIEAYREDYMYHHNDITVTVTNQGA